MHLTLIRHTSVDVKPGTCYGATDVGLSSAFETEAAQVKHNLEGKVFDKVFTSPLTRCRKLASFCGFNDAIPDDRLMEMNFGEWEMKEYDLIEDPRLQEWFDDYINVRATGGESFMDQQKRVKSFINDIKMTGCDNIAVFAHAGILLQFMLLTSMITPAEAFRKQPPFGGIIEVDI
ncbi:MAG: alpha-ribazole phosphatase [Muribaculaceae bacterium]|nr:alpha-ribazole phosphatase [Muribaculaceae bacterium]MDE6809353.1 alpha-ribazole phosphatase [Muribaculaceae bacterium]